MAENTNTEREATGPAEVWLRSRYGAYRGHFAWRELEEAFQAGRASLSLPATLPEGISLDDTVHGETYFTAADMATAAAQGFRDGVASLSLPAAGQEPVAWQCRHLADGLWQECTAEVAAVRANRPEKWEVRALSIYAAPQPAVAAGWVMVPVEPTLEMLRAGDEKTWVLPALDCWRAMLKAAPLPPAPSTEGESNANS